MKLLTIDIGGTEIKYGIVDDRLDITNKHTFPTPTDRFEHLIETLYEIYLQYQNEVEGIAIAMPGFIDADAGFCYQGGALRYNANKPFADILAKTCNCKVHIDNDGKAAALAEYKAGALQGCQNGAVFIIGTGVGGGLIINGQLVRGRNFTAGEFSYINVNNTLQNGMSGMLTAYCSTTALLDNFTTKANITDDINEIDFFKYLSDNNKDAITVFDEFCMNIAIQISNLGILLNVETVAIGGGISRQPILVETIRSKMKLIGIEPMIPNVVNCHFHSDANLIGAYMSFQ